LAQAADEVGCSEGLVRKLVRKGEALAQEEKTPSGFRYVIAREHIGLLAHKVAMAKTGRGAPTSPSPKQAATAPDVVRAEEARIAELQGQLAEVRADRDAWREQARRLGEALQQLALPAAREAPGETAPAKGGGFWAWLWGR